MSYAQHRETGSKVKQSQHIDIEKLILEAMSHGCEEEMDVACWIIDHSAYWKSQGYHKIIEEFRKEQQ